MTPANLNLGGYVRGDTINAKRFTLTKTVDAVTSAIDLTGAAITITFVKFQQKITKSIGSGVTVITADAGIFELDSFSLPTVGDWAFDVQITFAGGDVKTYLTGTVTITKDSTK